MGGGIVLLILWLLMRRRGRQETFAPPIKVPSPPTMQYIVPDNEAADDVIPHESLFDWMNGDQCGCGGPPIDILIIDSARLAPRTQPGYTYVPQFHLPEIPPALKGATPLVQSPAMPSPPIYQAALPTFWWGWSGLSRVIYTSDGFTLRTGLSNRLWTDATPGGNMFSEITAIKYNAQTYQLNRSRSVGL